MGSRAVACGSRTQALLSQSLVFDRAIDLAPGRTLDLVELGVDRTAQLAHDRVAIAPNAFPNRTPLLGPGPEGELGLDQMDLAQGAGGESGTPGALVFGLERLDEDRGHEEDIAHRVDTAPRS